VTSGNELLFDRMLQKIRERTPARLLEGRSGASYRTKSQLELRDAHAAAVDAVRDELDLVTTLGEEFCRTWNLFEVVTEAASKEEYLLRPDKGRRLNASSRRVVAERCPAGADVQLVIGDGLSVAAVAGQVPTLLPLIIAAAKLRGWTVGQTFVVRHCRVGVLNDIGTLLSPAVTVLLIGERPGLATAESLSAYLAYRTNASHTDADRNLISNIHARGMPPQQAAGRVLDLVAAMLRQRLSGTGLTLTFEKECRLTVE
jgi:ethanolamine ammonia-lyase small subunit